MERVDKRSAGSIPTLQSDVLLNVFSRISVTDIGKSRLVCRAWQHCIDCNAPFLWKVRCNALGILTTQRDTVLGACVEETIAQAQRIELALSIDGLSDKERFSQITNLARIYRNHYFTWVRHVCRTCIPLDMCSLCEECTPPHTFEWIREVNNGMIELIVLPRNNVRSVKCPRPPHEGLGKEWAGMLYRLSDKEHSMIQSYGKRLALKLTSEFREHCIFSR